MLEPQNSEQTVQKSDLVVATLILPVGILVGRALADACLFGTCNVIVKIWAPASWQAPPPENWHGLAPTPIQNRIPLATRIGHVLSPLALASYGVFGLIANDIYLPAKRGGTHFRGAAAIVMFGAMCAACAVLLSTVASHYDRRNNEHRYRALARYGQVIAWSLAGLAFLLARSRG